MADSPDPPDDRAVGRWREIGAIGLLTVVVAALSFIAQPQITVNDGRGWDGGSYFAVAQQMAADQPVVGRAPFVQRILVPSAAALFGSGPADVMTGFRVVNGIAVIVIVVLMTMWLRTHFAEPWLRLVLVALFLVQWTEPVRTFFWYPVLVDYWLVVTLLAGLLCIDRLRAGGRLAVWVPAIAVTSVVAVAVREIGLLIPLAALFARNPLTGAVWRLRARLADLRGIPPALLAPLAVACGAAVGTRLLATTVGSYDVVRTVGYWLVHKGPLAYVLSWFLSYGPVLVLPLIHWRACGRYLREHQAEAAFLAGLIGMAYVGGNDTERFVTWGAPVVYVLIGLALRELLAARPHPLLLGLLVITQALAARLFWVVPAVPVEAGSGAPWVLFTPLGNDISVFDLAAWDAAGWVRWILVGEYALLAAVVVGLVWWTGRPPDSVVRRTSRHSSGGQDERPGASGPSHIRAWWRVP